MNWISVKDQLPEYDTDVLIASDDDEEVYIGFLNVVSENSSGRYPEFLIRYNYQPITVKLWMPLPPTKQTTI